MPQSAPAITRLLVYPGDLTIVEEIAPVVLPQGRSTVRLDFVRGNADVASLEDLVRQNANLDDLGLSLRTIERVIIQDKRIAE